MEPDIIPSYLQYKILQSFIRHNVLGTPINIVVCPLCSKTRNPFRKSIIHSIYSTLSPHKEFNLVEISVYIN